MNILNFNKIDKIDTKDELKHILNNYKGILSDAMINYLNSLIELEFSVVRDYISESDRTCLSELEIYKRVAMYNIYYKALNLFKENEINISMYSNNENYEGLKVYYSLSNKNINLFDYNYKEGTMGFKSKIPNGYKTMNIGNITLFKTVENKKQKEAELMRLLIELNRLYDEKNPYMLIEDVLNTCIDYKSIEKFFNSKGYVINTVKLPGRELPPNATALLVSKLNHGEFSEAMLQEYMEKYLVISDPTIEKIDARLIMLETMSTLKKAFKIDYARYCAMFEPGSILKETIDVMVDLALSLDEDRYSKLHRLKRMLPEGFLQRRIMCCNYKVLRNMIQQRFMDPFMHWRKFIQQIISHVEHPEYFEDILAKFNTTVEEIKNHKCNGKPYDYVE